MTASTAMKAAVDNGAKVVVCAGFMQDATLCVWPLSQFTDVPFVFIDGDAIRVDAEDEQLRYPDQRGRHCLQGRAVRLSGRLRRRQGRLHQAGLLPAAAAAPTPPAAVTATAIVQGANAAAAGDGRERGR